MDKITTKKYVRLEICEILWKLLNKLSGTYLSLWFYTKIYMNSNIHKIVSLINVFLSVVDKKDKYSTKANL